MLTVEVAAHEHAQPRTGASARLLGQLQNHAVGGETLSCPTTRSASNKSE